MPERRKYGRDVLIEALDMVSVELDYEIRAYCVGGLSMMFLGAKDSTKDVDMVFGSRGDAEEFIRAAKTAGFAREEGLSDEYIDLRTMAVLRRADDVRLDLFVNKVCGKLTYTPSMRSRAKGIELEGNLSFHFSSAEDIFLLKAVTARPDDLADMAVLAQKELDWDIIEKEVRSQPDSLEWLGRLFGRLMELKGEFKIGSPLLRSLRDDAELAQAIGNLRNRLESGALKVSEAHELLEGDAEFADKVIDEAVRLGYIERNKNILRLKRQ